MAMVTSWFVCLVVAVVLVFVVKGRAMATLGAWFICQVVAVAVVALRVRICVTGLPSSFSGRGMARK